jgi:hypothetical protein
LDLPSHLFIADDGALYDTRDPDWSHRPLRANYSRTHRQIESVADVKASLRAGPYAWPGGYPMFFLMADGEAMCFESVRKNFDAVAEALTTGFNRDWKPVAVEINYEDADLRCAHDMTRIPSAYAEEEVEEEA